MTHRERLTFLVPSPIDYSADREHIYLHEPTISRRPVSLNHAEARALLRRLADRYPEEVDMIVTERAETRSGALTELSDSARRIERWCSWCAGPVSTSEDYARHMARHI